MHVRVRKRACGLVGGGWGDTRGLAPFPASAADFSVRVIKLPLRSALGLGASVKDCRHPPTDLCGGFQLMTAFERIGATQT